MRIIQFITDSENVSKAEKLDQRLQFGKQIKMTQPIGITVFFRQ